MSDDIVTLDVTEEGVAVVTLNRPHVHNAFDEAMINALNETFVDLANQDHVRLVLLKAQGKSFSAGADLDWMRRAAGYTPRENQEDAEALAGMLRALRNLPQPTIALVQGAAVGGGVGLVAACDIALAVRTATFRLSEVRLGLIPGAISPYVVEAIGPRQARRYFLTAETFDAASAKSIGLVHEVVEDADGLAREVENLSSMILDNAPGALAAAKDLINLVAGEAADQAMVEASARAIAERRQTPEGREGVAAFLDKRKPSWTIRG